jgi:membrane-bound lytic murein transglycosylase D
MRAPLIRLIHSVLLAVAILIPTQVAHAEEPLAQNISLADQAIPRTLPNARNIMLEFIPDDESAPGDLWARIRNGFAMRDLNSPLVARHEKWYASRPDYVARMTDRARRYLHYITTEVERRGMPSEIALLPMIESAFNPGAYSTARASGIWQFIPSTGKNFGMEQNWWYDGRRDIVSATNGALDYLQKLHDMFGDWELALAAYNWGEGAVQRAQARNRKRGLPVNYTSLKMPKETRSYVPKLLAVKNIVANPASFGLVLGDIPDEPYFAAVATSKHMDVKLAAQLADISMEEFKALNPAHNRPVILQDSSDLILLPTDAVETFSANLENLV